MTLLDEALRYLDCKKPDAYTSERAAFHLEWLGTNVPGACVTREFSCEVSDKTVRFADTEIKSADLARYISGCRELILFAATLGAGVGTRYRAVSAESVADALVFDACANAYIERFCDMECGVLAKRRHGLTGRFSPGYGDLDLSFQPTLLKLLEAQKRIGLTVTRDFSLIPEKSVTAIIGIRG